MSRQVLYVEDHPFNRILVQRILQADGYTMLAATDGEQGWQMALTHRPDLILMDLRLPGPLDGFELTRRIKQHPGLRHIPVIALTAYGHEEAEQKARAAGCDGFLHKPADIRQIRATLSHYLGQALPLDQPGRAAYVYL